MHTHLHVLGRGRNRLIDWDVRALIRHNEDVATIGNIHTHTHTHAHTDTHTRTHACNLTKIYLHTHTHTHTHTHPRKKLRTLKLTCTHARTHTRVHVHTDRSRGARRKLARDNRAVSEVGRALDVGVCVCMWAGFTLQAQTQKLQDFNSPPKRAHPCACMCTHERTPACSRTRTHPGRGRGDIKGEEREDTREVHTHIRAHTHTNTHTHELRSGVVLTRKKRTRGGREQGWGKRVRTRKGAIDRTERKTKGRR